MAQNDSLGDDANGGVLCSRDKLGCSLLGYVPIPSKTRAGSSQTSTFNFHAVHVSVSMYRRQLTFLYFGVPVILESDHPIGCI